jgi:hypothetical protein
MQKDEQITTRNTCHHFGQRKQQDDDLEFAAGLGLASYRNDDEGFGSTKRRVVDGNVLTYALSQATEVGILTRARIKSHLTSISTPNDVLSMLLKRKGKEKEEEEEEDEDEGKRSDAIQSITDASKLALFISEIIDEVKRAKSQIEDSISLEAEQGCATQ